MAEEGASIATKAASIEQRYRMRVLSLQQAALEYMQLVPDVLAEMERLRDENAAIRKILKLIAIYYAKDGPFPESAYAEMRAFFADDDD